MNIAGKIIAAAIAVFAFSFAVSGQTEEPAEAPKTDSSSEYPQIFGGVGCVSTHWIAADGAVIEYLRKNLPAAKNHKFYFDFGTETLDSKYEPFQNKMDEVMRAKGYVAGKNWVTRKFVGAEHSEKSWRERVDDPLTFLLGR
jgi:hypothetical protein